MKSEGPASLPMDPVRVPRRAAPAHATVPRAARTIAYELLAVVSESSRLKFQIPRDLVVKLQGVDIAGVILSLMRRSNVVQTLCRNRKSRIKLLSPSEDHWSTTKSGGIWEISAWLRPDASPHQHILYSGAQ